MTTEPAKRGRGRQPGFRMTEAHRLKIQNSNILSVLIQHVKGKRDMSQSQVTAGLGLLKKVLPDLSTTTLVGDPDQPLVTRVELVAGEAASDAPDELWTRGQ